MVRKKSKKVKKKKQVSKAGFDLSAKRNIILTAAIFLSVILGVFYGFRHYLFNDPLFAVDKINIRGGNADIDGRLLGGLEGQYIKRNIFSVDLKFIERTVNDRLPYLKDVEIRRELPNTISIYITERVPVAIIDDGSGVVIDREAVVLDPDVGARDVARIRGISFFLRTPRPGQIIRTKLVNRSLEIIGLLSKEEVFAVHKVNYIDVSNKDNLTLSVDGVLVKLGKSDFSRNIKRLAEILGDPTLDMKDIAYIDLRFEDVVIAPK